VGGWVGRWVGGCWVLGAGCWVLGAGCWVLGDALHSGVTIFACRNYTSLRGWHHPASAAVLNNAGTVSERIGFLIGVRVHTRGGLERLKCLRLGFPFLLQ